MSEDVKETLMEMEEEKIESAASEPKPKKENQKRLEMVLLLVLGILVGFSVKTEAAKRITMGSGDYLLSQKDTGSYDINAIQKDLLAKGEVSDITNTQATGGSCGQ